MNPILKEFWQTPARVKVLYGGRASGKTWDASMNAIRLADMTKLRFLCARQLQNRIADSVYTNLVQQIQARGLQHRFKITDNSIINTVTGSEFLFYGLWRSIDEIKSLEGIDVCWLEEAHNLTKEQWEILEPTIRKENSQFWIIFNPRLRTDFVYKTFVINPPKYVLSKKINYTDNPFLSNTMLEVIEAKKNESYEDYAHIYLGEPKTSDVNSLFPYDLIEKSMERYGDDSGATVIGLDVARYGDDSSCLVVRKGLRVLPIEVRTNSSTVEVASWASLKINDHKADGIIVDTIGIGAGVYDQLQVRGFYAISGNFADKADDSNTYHNKRAESYFRLKDAMTKGLALPRDDALMEELASITYSVKENGKLIIAPKDDIKEELGRSPDKADALALTFFTTVTKQSREYTDYELTNSNVF